jgi:hypothetical protein
MEQEWHEGGTAVDDGRLVKRWWKGAAIDP